VTEQEPQEKTEEETKAEEETKTEEPVDWEKRYKDLQAHDTSQSQELKGYQDQLTAAGYTIGDGSSDDFRKGVIYGPPPTTEKTSTPDADEDEEISDPIAAKVIKRLQADRADDREAIEVLSLGASQSGKRDFLKLIGKDSQKAAGQSWDEKMSKIPAKLRANPGTHKAVRGMVLAEMLDDMGAEAFVGGGKQTETSLGTLGAGASDRPGGDQADTKPPPKITEDHRKTYRGLGGKEALGKTLEEFAAEDAQQEEIDRSE